MHQFAEFRQHLYTARHCLLGLFATLSFTATAADTACHVIPTLPGTPALPAREQASQAFCTVDFSGENTAICPKTWSTSAAALVYDLEGTVWQERRAEFEREVCPRGTHAGSEASRELAVFKHSMNFRDTSGTYAPSILLYDHLSRWLNTTVQVPTAAEYRFAREWYARRVVKPGIALASQHASRKMLLAAWQHMDKALETAGSSDGRELLIEDGQDVWGAALLFTGKRYGPEINGTRESGWGSGQNYDFQHTAPFLALRNGKELLKAVAEGIDEARSDPAMAHALPADANPKQVAWWMLEVLEIVVLDYLLGQQDRIGNIDYQWRWVWMDSGKLNTLPATEDSPPAPNALRLRTTWLNDNDAGVRNSYANYARKTGMLTGLRHFNPSLYRRLKMLAGDMAAQGPVYQALANNYHLRSGEVASIVDRVAEVDQIISRDCRAGNYRFDLRPTEVLGETAPAAEVSCD
jgi:hypothetical protein